MATTWNPSRQTNVTLSGGNLIASSSGQGSIVTVDANNSGKWYAEFVFNVIAQAGTNIGITNNNINTATFESTAIPGIIINKSGTIYANNSAVIGSPGALVNGSLVCLAIDLNANLVWFKIGATGNWNNNASYNPATGVGGISTAGVCSAGMPCLLLAGFGAASDQIAANFGGSAFTGAVPSGFTAGFNATGLVIVTNAIVTQASIEEFGGRGLLVNAQVTQVAVEQWVSASSLIPSLAIVTQVGVEMWAKVTPPPPPPVTMKPYAMILA